MLTRPLSLALLASVFWAASVAAGPGFVYVNAGTVPNAVEGFRIAPDGSLTPVPGSPFATGGVGRATFSSPSIVVSPNRPQLFVANEANRSVSVLTIDPATGALTLGPGSPFVLVGPPDRSASYGISLALSRDGRFLYAANSENNLVHGFLIDTDGSLTPTPGGPVRMAGAPLSLATTVDGRFLIAGTPGSFFVLGIAADGSLGPTPQSTFTDLGPGVASALSVDCGGSLLFAPESQAASLAVDVFTISAAGVVTPVSGSPFAVLPGVQADTWDSVLSPDGRFLFVPNRSTGAIAAIAVAPGGVLGTVVGSPFPAGGRAHTLVTDASGAFLYGTSEAGGVLALGIAGDGSLAAVPGSPFATQTGSSFQTSLAVYPPAGCGAYDRCPAFVPPTPPPAQRRDVFTLDAVRFDFAAVDPDHPAPVTLELREAPAGARFTATAGDPATGRFDWTPGPADLGRFVVRVDAIAGGANPCTTSTRVLLTVASRTAPPRAPEFLYVALGAFDNALAGYRIEFDGALSPVPGSPYATGGGGSGPLGLPTSGRIAIAGTRLFVANDGAGISVFDINATTGALSRVPGSPFRLGADGGPPSLVGISISATPDGRFLYAARAGNSKIEAFAVQPDGSLSPLSSTSFPFGFAISHLRVSSDGRFLAMTRFSILGTDEVRIALFRIGAAGGLTAAGSAVGSGQSEFTCGAGFVYTDGVRGYQVSSTGLLTAVPRSPSPGGGDALALTPDDRWLYSTSSSGVSGFALGSDGALSPLAGSPYASGPRPIQVIATRSGEFCYALDANGTVAGYGIAGDGGLTPLAPAPFGVGSASSGGLGAFPARCASCAAFVPPTPVDEAVITVEAGSPWSLPLRALDADAARTVTLSAAGLPGSAVFTAQAGNPATASLDWTPGLADLGPHALTFTATSDASPPCATTTRLVVQVVCPALERAPQFAACTPVVEAIAGSAVSLEVSASDADAGDAVTLSVTGLPPSATLTPPAPVTGNPAVTRLDWTPADADVGDHVIAFVATDRCGVASTCDATVRVTLRRVEIGFEFKPHSLHLKSKDRWVTGYLRPPDPLRASQIDVASIRLNGTAEVSTQHPPVIDDHDTRLKVKFRRSDVAPTLVAGDHVPVTVTGRIDGQPFTGTDFIKVKGPKVHTPKAGDVVAAGNAVTIRWENLEGTVPSEVTLVSSNDDGLTWTVEASGIPNTGSCSWVASVPTTTARVGILLVYGSDETGLIPESELAVSDAFSVAAPAAVGDAEPVLALRRSNPLSGPLVVRFSLAGDEAATLSVFDIGGRRIASRQVGSFGPGWHAARFEDVPPGMYVVRLAQAGRQVSARVAVIR